MGNNLLEKSGRSLYDVWQTELEKCRWYTLLSYDDRQFMGELGKNIGNLDRMSQLHTLEIFKQRLVIVINDARDEYKGQAKVCHVVGVTAGIFISILLI